MTGSGTSNSPQRSEDKPRAHEWCYLPLLLCGRVVALCSPHVVCCLSAILHIRVVLPTAAAVRKSCRFVLFWYGTISYTKYTNLDMNIRTALSNKYDIQTILTLYAGMSLDT